MKLAVKRSAVYSSGVQIKMRAEMPRLILDTRATKAAVITAVRDLPVPAGPLQQIKLYFFGRKSSAKEVGSAPSPPSSPESAAQTFCTTRCWEESIGRLAESAS